MDRVSVKKSENKNDVKIRIKECSICGYVYKAEEGDSEGGIKAGTEFKKLPAAWECPVCGAEKAAFKSRTIHE